MLLFIVHLNIFAFEMLFLHHSPQFRLLRGGGHTGPVNKLLFGNVVSWSITGSLGASQIILQGIGAKKISALILQGAKPFGVLVILSKSMFSYKAKSFFKKIVLLISMHTHAWMKCRGEARCGPLPWSFPGMGLSPTLAYMSGSIPLALESHTWLEILCLGWWSQIMSYICFGCVLFFPTKFIWCPEVEQSNVLKVKRCKIWVDFAQQYPHHGSNTFVEAHKRPGGIYITILIIFLCP